MDTELRMLSFFRKAQYSISRSGFAIAEVLIAIGLVGMAALIVGGLGQQVLNLAKSSKQTAASIELRTKTNSISRNLDSWLGKMRSSLETNGLYAACIPDPSAATSLFKCPAVDAALLDSDSELKRIAGTQLHAVSAPVIDLLGERIAGTTDDPLYLDLDGRKCQQTNQLNCPLKSTGFFLRSNPAVDATPGSVRFIVKIEANRSSEQIKGTAPQRTQYLSIDVGSEWQQVVGTCPAGSIKIGYLASGSPNCVHPTKKCAAGTVALGLDNSANPICATPPAACVSGGAIVDTASNTLVCSSSSPCSANQIFLGYYSGTGTPMCSGTNISCPDGQVQVGIQGTSGSLTALCKTLPSCQDSQKLSYDGSQFVCQSATVASNCGDGEVVVGINTDGSAKCQPAERTLASTELSCPNGQYVSGLEPSGKVICRTLASSVPAFGAYNGPLWRCTCGGYINMLTTSNLIYGETCVFGNGGTANNVQYSAWSCTQVQNGSSASASTSQFDPTPIASTFPTTRFYAPNDTQYRHTGESITVTVPAGTPKKFRISLRQMASGVGGQTMVAFALSTNSSTYNKGNIVGLGTPWLVVPVSQWATVSSEGYVELSSGTHTFYVMVWAHNHYSPANIANSSGDAGQFSQVLFWPLN